nr:hypothetical protein [uncultured Cohaesibacter sp.]
MKKFLKKIMDKCIKFLEKYSVHIASSSVIIGGLFYVHMYLLELSVKPIELSKKSVENNLNIEIERNNQLNSQIGSLSRDLSKKENDISDLRSQLIKVSTANEINADKVVAYKNEIDKISDRNGFLEERFEEIFNKYRELSFIQLSEQAELKQLRYTVSILSKQILSYRRTLSSQVSDDYSDEIHKINQNLRFFEIIRWPIKISGWKIDAAFLITRQEDSGMEFLPHSLLLFEPYRYMLQDGFKCTEQAELCSEVCNLIDKAALTFLDETGSEYHKALSLLGTMEDGKSFEQAALAEISSIYRVIHSISDNTHLFFRGTAGTQSEQWDQPLDERFYYDRVDYLSLDISTCNKSDAECWRFDKEQMMLISDPYSAKHLANLRARYLEKNVEDLLQSCNSNTSLTKIGILEGINNSHLAESANEKMRTVMGVILIGKEL